MKLSALALDYDGTIAVNDTLDPAVRAAIAEVRRRGVVVVLATGRQLADLRRVAGDLACFDAIVAENGAVLHFPASGRHMLLAHAPNPALLNELHLRHVAFTAGESVVEADASTASTMLEVVRSLELPLALVFNRGRRTKYVDMPVADSHAFVFGEGGHAGPRARTLKQFTDLLSELPAERLGGHLRRHDLSRWIGDVFRDRPLAQRIRTLEARVAGDEARDVAGAIAQAIRARYETPADAA